MQKNHGRSQLGDNKVQKVDDVEVIANLRKRLLEFNYLKHLELFRWAFAKSNGVI